MRGVGNEALLRLQVLLEPHHHVVEGDDQRAHLLRHARRRHRRQIGGAPPADQALQAVQGGDAARQTNPHQHDRKRNDRELRQEHAGDHSRGQVTALVARLRHLYQHLVDGETEQAQAILTFYDEYLAVNDLPAEFYLETVHRVFQTYDLPRGALTVAGRAVRPEAIRRTALLTVEGERDDICAVGQTVAAQDLCPGIRPYLKSHHLQAGVGHYGVFSGSKWNTQIYPRVRETIRMAAELH